MQRFVPVIGSPVNPVTLTLTASPGMTCAGETVALGPAVCG